MARLTRDDVSAEAFRFLNIRHTAVAGVPCLLARVSFTGELGYEIHAPQAAAGGEPAADPGEAQ